MTGSIHRDRSDPKRGDMIRYHSLTSNSVGYVHPLLDPKPPEEQYKEKWNQKRLSWGHGIDQFISDVTPTEKNDIDRRRRIHLFRSGLIFWALVLSFIVIMMGLIVGRMEGSVWITMIILLGFLIVTAIGGTIFINRRYKENIEDQRRSVQVPDCVVELTEKYLSVMFKGTQYSDEYMIYYDQIKGLKLLERDRTYKRAPMGTTSRVKLAMDPTYMTSALYPIGTPKDHVIVIKLKERIQIDRRKIMTHHFKKSSKLPRENIISDRIMISIRPENQDRFIEKLKEILEDEKSCEGQEFYPAWK